MRKGIAALAAMLAAGLLLGGCSGSKQGSAKPVAETREAKRAPAQDSATEAGAAPTAAPADDAGAGAELLAANADRPRVATPPARESVDEYRPSWWVTQPVNESGAVTVGGIGEAAELVDARRLAVADAGRALREHLGKEPTGADTERYTAIRLPNGSYRAFVLMSGKD